MDFMDKIIKLKSTTFKTFAIIVSVLRTDIEIINNKIK